MKTTYRRAQGFFVGVDYELPAEYASGPHPPKGFKKLGARNGVEALSDALAPALYRSAKLSNEGATRDTILATLEDTVQEARSRDLVIAYFRAYTVPDHPYEDMYLIPYGFEPKAILETAVPFRLITAVLGYRKSLLILDICGAARVGFDMSRYGVGPGLSLMVSCGPDESSASGEFEGVLHGKFTWGLVEALNRERAKAKGAAWRVSLINWFDAAYESVVERETHQHPLFLGTLSPNLELRSRRSTDPEVVTVHDVGGRSR